jgi:hypothetical protein
MDILVKIGLIKIGRENGVGRGDCLLQCVWNEEEIFFPKSTHGSSKRSGTEGGLIVIVVVVDLHLALIIPAS